MTAAVSWQFGSERARGRRELGRRFSVSEEAEGTGITLNPALSLVSVCRALLRHGRNLYLEVLSLVQELISMQF